jgi:hypothetical protein
MCSVPGNGVQGEGATYSKRSASVYEASPGKWVLQLTVWGRRGFAKTTFYDLTALPAPAWGTSAWRLVKAEAKERAVYEVLLSADLAQESCTCPHGTYRPNAAPCVHRASLKALIARGKLPAPKPAPSPATKPRVPAVADPGYQTDDDDPDATWGGGRRRRPRPQQGPPGRPGARHGRLVRFVGHATLAGGAAPPAGPRINRRLDEGD